MNGEWGGDDEAEHHAPESRAAYVAALAQACADARESMLDAGNLKAWHRLAFKGLVTPVNFAGNFRGDNYPKLKKRPVYVGGIQGTEPHLVRFAVIQLMDDLKQRLLDFEAQWSSLTPDQRASELASIIGNIVGAFIRIHPFANGNGRTSRLLWGALLYRYGLPPDAAALVRPDPPYEELMAAAMSGNDKPTMEYVLKTMSAASRAALQNPNAAPAPQAPTPITPTTQTASEATPKTGPSKAAS